MDLKSHISGRFLGDLVLGNLENPHRRTQLVPLIDKTLQPFTRQITTSGERVHEAAGRGLDRHSGELKTKEIRAKKITILGQDIHLCFIR